jgi:hypothetical protein
MSSKTMGLATVLVALFVGMPSAAQAEILNTYEYAPHSVIGTGSLDSWSGFYTIPNLSATDAATHATITLNGTLWNECGGTASLVDGKWPSSSDQLDQVLAFTGEYASLTIDLGKVIQIGEINTYTRHTDERTAQNYTLWGSTNAQHGRKLASRSSALAATTAFWALASPTLPVGRSARIDMSSTSFSAVPVRSMPKRTSWRPRGCPNRARWLC